MLSQSSSTGVTGMTREVCLPRCILGARLGGRSLRLPYLASAGAAAALAATVAFALPETRLASLAAGQRLLGPRAALAGLRGRDVLPVGWLAMFSGRGVYRNCGRAVPVLALTLALQRLPCVSHPSQHSGWSCPSPSEPARLYMMRLPFTRYFGTYDVQDAHARTRLGCEPLAQG